MPYVYSTSTSTTDFAIYAPKADANTLGRIVKKITIKGGHNLKNHKGIDTPNGVVTKVSDEDLAILEQHPCFKQQVADGFLTVDKKHMEPSKKVVNMKQKDGSAPLTPKDYEKSENSTKELPLYKTKVVK